MKKKSIFIILLGSMFALGIVLAITGVIMGASVEETSLKRTRFSNKDSVPHELENVSLNDMTDIQKINFDLSANDVIIRQGEKFSIQGGSLKRNEVIDGTWYVESQYKYSSSEIKFFGLHIPLNFHFDFNDRDEEIIITLPGHCTLEKATFDVSASDIEFENINVKELTLSSSAASTEFDQINAEQVSLDLAAGSITMDKFHITDKLDISCSMGDVELGENSSLTDNLCNNMSIDCAMGGVDFFGKATGRNSISCSMGDVELSLLGCRGNYTFDSSVSLGDIDYSGDTSHSSTEEFGTIDIDCSLGNVGVHFS